MERARDLSLAETLAGNTVSIQGPLLFDIYLYFERCILFFTDHSLVNKSILQEKAFVGL